MKIKLTAGALGSPGIEIEGEGLPDFLRYPEEMIIRQETASGPARMDATFTITECEIDVEASEVRFNGEPVDKAVALDTYQKLKEFFED